VRLESDNAELVPFLFDGWKAARNYLSDQPTHGSYHVQGFESANYAGYTPEQVLRTPGLLDLFNDERIIARVAAFLGAAPVLYSVNAWWSLVKNAPEGPYSQFFHRDIDADRFLVLFVYLTDVSMDGGPHQVQRNDKTIISCLGIAGTMWLVNTLAPHRGLMPTTEPRLVCWARYGHGPNRNSVDKYGVAPQPVEELPTMMTGTPSERHINSLLVAFP
jgi:hypothetical protein